ncbi:MAG: TIR domain-containing protein [Pseudomonadota bacterium]
MVDVFISYARRQRAMVEPLKARFEAMGLDVFFDLEGIDGGAVLPDVITCAAQFAR